MFQRNWFFWMEALQITAGERRIMLGLISVFLVVTGINLFGPTRTIYDNSYYEPVITEFIRLSGIRQEERAVLLARYYPPPDRNNSGPSLMDEYILPGKTNLVFKKEDNNDAMPVQAESVQAESAERAGHEGSRSQRSGAEGAKSGETKINIQLAGRDELIRLPGIGPVTAGRIIEYREKNGPFRQPEDLLKVSGIGPVTLENIRDMIIVEQDPGRP